MKFKKSISSSKIIIFGIIIFTAIIVFFVLKDKSINKNNFDDPAVESDKGDNSREASDLLGKGYDSKNDSSFSGDNNSGNAVIDYEMLRVKFPGNLALPTMGRDETEIRKADRERRNLAYGQIAANRASEKDINAYYDEQLKISDDAIVLLEFILKEYKDRLSELQRKKYNFGLQQFRQRKEIIPGKRQEALERLKNRKR